MAQIANRPASKFAPKKELEAVAISVPARSSLLLFAGYAWLTLNFAYSAGQRTGCFQKISRRAGFAGLGRANWR
jgi:hypothetical protein